MIVGLVSCYREGRLVAGAVRSALAACDVVHVAEGPWGEAPDVGEPSDLERWHKPRKPKPRAAGGVYVRYGRWEDDAAKRTWLLEQTRPYDPPVWGVWVDGDELLLWGEYLRDMVARAETETGTGGFGLRLVELDGSVAMCQGKVIRCENVRRYLVSSYQVELLNGMTVALPNVPHWDWQRGGPTGHRPPLAGEPHLLHRSGLRAGERAELRGHDAEAQWFTELALPDGSTRQVPIG